MDSKPSCDLPDTISKVLGSPGCVDTHCHLEFIFERLNFHQSFATFKNTYQNEFPDNFESCVAVFCQPSLWRNFNFDTLSEDRDVWFLFGVHPHHAKDFDLSLLKRFLKLPKVIGLGEIGLDYSKKNQVESGLQKDVFRQ